MRSAIGIVVLVKIVGELTGGQTDPVAVGHAFVEVPDVADVPIGNAALVEASPQVGDVLVGRVAMAHYGSSSTSAALQQSQHSQRPSSKRQRMEGWLQCSQRPNHGLYSSGSVDFQR